MRNHRRIVAAFFLSAALLVTPALARNQQSFSANLHSSIGRCAAIVACRTSAVDASLATLRSDVDALARGAAGPAAWIKLAGSIQGLDVRPLAPVASTPRASILALYSDAGVHVDNALSQRIDAALASVGAREATVVGDVAGALVASSRAAREATRGSGLERIAADPVRAMHLVTLIASTPEKATPALRREYAADLATLGRVNMSRMASAALTLALAINEVADAPPTGDIDLPFIAVGHDGDTTYNDALLIQIDSSGNDTYNNNAGGGVVYAGSALAIDQGAGDDTYTFGTGGQGWGLGGVGILYDEGGSDHYNNGQFGQGAAVAGVGMLYDAGDGNDVYLGTGDAPISDQGSTLGGIGILVDEGGSDALRQDGLDGFVYGAAGGLGLMANLGDGNDTYRSDDITVELLGIVQGQFTGPVQISAEVGGTAILYEEGGDDSYQCGAHVRQGCQGAGGVGGTALLWDLSGNDSYWMGASVAPDLGDALGTGPIGVAVFPMGQGIGYGPSEPPGHGLGILRDEAGVDSYTAEKWAQGYAAAGGIGLLYDTGGAADTYNTLPPFMGSRADGMQWFDGTGGIGIDE